jgi:hypothetical protein
VVAPIAETTTHTGLPASAEAHTRAATWRIRSGPPTDVPPYFWTTSSTARTLPAEPDTRSLALVKAPWVLGTAAVAVLAAGCGGGAETCVQGAGTGPVQQTGTAGTAYLTGLSVARAGCADRVTFTFAKSVPGYRVEYRPAAEAQTEDASGRHIPVAGNAFLVVRLASAQTARATADGSLTHTYTGPRRVPGRSAQHAQEAVKTGDFEGVITWAIGLDGKRPFAVSTSGRSLVVDVG